MRSRIELNREGRCKMAAAPESRQLEVRHCANESAPSELAEFRSANASHGQQSQGWTGRK